MDDQVYISINRWRELRLARGLGLREAARRARIDPGHLSRVERGHSSLSLLAAGRLARVLGIRDLGWLFDLGTEES